MQPSRHFRDGVGGLWDYFLATVTSNGSPYATDRYPVCSSVTLVYCGRQTVEWIKMPLGTEVHLGPGHIVLDRDPTPATERGTAAPTFRPMSIVAKRTPNSVTAEFFLSYLSSFRLLYLLSS